MQATVYRFDATTRAGSVITDQGQVLPFGADALDLGGLRHVRTGQRLTVELAVDAHEPGPRVARLSLGTITPLRP